MLSFSVPPGYRRSAPSQAAEAGRVHRDHRPVAAGRSRPARQAAPHRQAGVRAAARRARVHRRLHDRQGLHPRASAARPGDVRAAAPSARPCPGRLRRGDGGDRRRRADGALLRLRPAAQRRLLRPRLSGGDRRGLGRRPRPCLRLLRRRAAVGALRQRPLPGGAHPARRHPQAGHALQRVPVALPDPRSLRPPGQGQRQGRRRGAGRLGAAHLHGAAAALRHLGGLQRLARGAMPQAPGGHPAGPQPRRSARGWRGISRRWRTCRPRPSTPATRPPGGSARRRWCATRPTTTRCRSPMATGTSGSGAMSTRW